MHKYKNMNEKADSKDVDSSESYQGKTVSKPVKKKKRTSLTQK